MAFRYRTLPYDKCVDHPEARVDPRITESRRRVLTVALTELAATGYGGFAIESVSRRSGVAKSTIYRHWPHKLALVADALRTLNVQPGSAGGEESPEQDPRARVVTIVRHLAAAFASSGSVVAAATPALVEAAERDDELRQLFHAYTAERRQALVDSVAVGVASGAFAPTVDAELAAIALAGAVTYRRLMTPTPLDPSDADALVTTVLGAPRRTEPRRHAAKN
jgi:TetR/AcrR family transcriptional regulator, regulator of autoinduction and epiphytic fitness